MNDGSLRDIFQQPSETRAGVAGPCPPPEALEALARHAGSEAERFATVNHLARCNECQRDFALLQTLRAGPESAGRWLRPLAALAAGLATLVSLGLLWRAMQPHPDSDQLRGAGAHVRLLQPASTVSITGPVRLVWSSVPTASAYRLELLDQAASLRFVVETADTQLTLPDSVKLQEGNSYHWLIRARLPDNTERKSELGTFRASR